MKPVVYKKTVGSRDIRMASDFLAAGTGLSKTKVKEAMNKGAVWLKKGKGKRRRLRRATAALTAGNVVEIFYDENILSKIPPHAALLSDRRNYSVWLKPAGMMTQGSNFGDHCTLLRSVELYFSKQRYVHPVHRLDREVPGVVLVAHSRDAARRFSALFQNRQVIKKYRAVIHGTLNKNIIPGNIDLPIEGKQAQTEFSVTNYSPAKNTTTVDITLITGRRHQLRRHFDMIGHPIMGDPLYGRGNKIPGGIKLTAVSLEFYCPFTNKNTVFAIEEENGKAGKKNF